MAVYDVGGRSAIVSGAGSGIGRAVAIELAANGASVLVFDLNGDAAEKVADEIVSAGGIGVAFDGDAADPETVERSVAAAQKLAPLGIAVNNAGITGESNPIGDYSIASWRKVMSVNLDSVFYALRAQLPVMVGNGGGSIINMASILGSVGFPGSSAYVAAKHGVVGLTQNAALEYATQGVRVNAVGPGFIHTPLLSDDAETTKFLADKHPIGRLGTPEEVANLVLFLASDASVFITGSYQLVDGGYTAHLAMEKY
ncbi:SDR family NAD(P)-dependent oxidoreductase [Nocardia sp. NPDC058705]|uniref:SDR family NAD(P)-dependent oxidoreductase n=1 Tax=Nocardia sp. NPDC058705 TaxID=3346609 RepID=UPI0036B64637